MTRLKESNGWDVSEMDGSGYACKETLTGEWLECQPVNDPKHPHYYGYQALIGGKKVSGHVWDMPDGAMDEAQAAYEALYPPFDVGALRSRVLEQTDAFSGDVVDDVTTCGFIKTGKSVVFSVWGKVDPPTVTDIVTRALKGQPVKVTVKHAYDSRDGNAWFTVTVKWVY